VDIEETTHNFFIANPAKRSEWYQCVMCYSDLRAMGHGDSCPLTEERKQAEETRVRIIIKSYFNAKSIEILKGGKK
jgi:hypothetical protein